MSNVAHGSDPVQIYQKMSSLADSLGAINLAQGLPEARFDPQWREAIRREVGSAHFQYTATRGKPDARSVIRRLYADEIGDPVLTSGCTESLAIALMAHASGGCRQVVWLEPFYSYYPGLARMAGLTSRSVPIDLDTDRPRLDTERLRRALVGGGPTIILVNSPHNPSGLTFDDADWEELVEIIASFDAYLLLDDVYRDFRYGPPPAPYRALMETCRVSIAGSVSKSFAATGLRLGWLFTPKGLDATAEGLHMHMSNCVGDLTQRAAIRVVDEVFGSGLLDAASDDYRNKRDRLVTSLTAAGFRAITPLGGHFVMAHPPASVKGYSSAEADAVSVALAHHAGVVPLPMHSFFGDAIDRPPPCWLRFSFAVSSDVIAEACHRLTSWERVTALDPESVPSR